MPPGGPPSDALIAAREARRKAATATERQASTKVRYATPILGMPGLGAPNGATGGMGKSTLLTGATASTASALSNPGKPRTKKTTLLGQ